MNIEGNETVILKLEQHPLNAALGTKVHKCTAMVALCTDTYNTETFSSY